MNNLADKLAQNEIFSVLPSAELEHFIQLGRRKTLKEDEYLFLQGDVWPFCVYVETGVLRWSMSSLTGHIYTLFTVETGGVFWGHSFFDSEPMPASLQAARESVVQQWHRDITMPLLLNNHQATRALLRHLVQTMRRARALIHDLNFKPVASRLARLLIERFPEADGCSVERDLTLEEMAAMVGSSPHVISRVLYQLQDEGLLEVTRATISLSNRAELERLIEQ